MKSKKITRNIINIILIATMLVNSFIFPPEAYARGFFKDTFRFLKRTTHFIITLPDKSTRWMGPVLGPIASTILTKNLLKNPKLSRIFRNARRTNDTLEKIENIRKQVKDTKKLYHDEAQKLRDKAAELENVRKGLAKDLLKHGNWEEYKEQVAAIQGLIEIHNEAANRFDNAANDINEGNITKILGSEVLDTVLGNVRDVVILEVSKDLEKVINPEIITKFLSGNAGLDTILDFFVDREMAELLGEDQLSAIDGDDLKNRVRDSIKEQIKKDRDFFKDNWHEKIAEIIQEKVRELEEASGDIEKQTNETVKEISETQVLTKDEEALIEEFESTLPDEDDESTYSPSGEKCGPGYVWMRMSGTGCVQGNCSSIPDAHLSYVGDCICGSSGSINEDPTDPNIECHFDASYSPCPSCTYMCVHTGSTCPLDDVIFED